MTIHTAAPEESAFYARFATPWPIYMEQLDRAHRLSDRAAREAEESAKRREIADRKRAKTNGRKSEYQSAEMIQASIRSILATKKSATCTEVATALSVSRKTALRHLTTMASVVRRYYRGTYLYSAGG